MTGAVPGAQERGRRLTRMMGDISLGVAAAEARCVPNRRDRTIVETRTTTPDETAGRRLALLGVNYTHFALADGGELFVTDYGLPFEPWLRPENWLDGGWFQRHAARLAGTSAVYRLLTREVSGRRLELVVKWSRVGEQVPLDTRTLNRFLGAEFNSPFEEFSLLMELRRSDPTARILTKRPLAIYAPSQRMQLWQSGRSEHIIRAKLARHPSVELDLLRQYVVIFQWVKGMDLVQAAEKLGLGGLRREEFLAQHTTVAIHEMELRGFRVLDMKPAHVIVRFGRDGRLLRRADGQLAYALVDYELLEHTPEREEQSQSVARGVYMGHLKKRFKPLDVELPPNLRRVRVDGVDYVAGRTESTGGWLFVAGRDPEMFNYFLPERWRRTDSEPVCDQGQLQFTRTKDKLPVLWEVGEGGSGETAFERFAGAFRRQDEGARVLSPRALYFPNSPELAKLEMRVLTGEWRSREMADDLPPSHIRLWGFLEYIRDADNECAWREGQVMRVGRVLEDGVLGERQRAALGELSPGAGQEEAFVVVGPSRAPFFDTEGHCLVILRR